MPGPSSIRVERRAQPIPARLQVLDHHLRVAEHGHEVGVSVPARDHVPVDVLGDPGSRGPPRFIPTLWPCAPYAWPTSRMATRSISASSHADRAERRQVGFVGARNHHQMAVVVGIAVEDRERVWGPARIRFWRSSRLRGDRRRCMPASRRLSRSAPSATAPRLLHHLTRFGARNMTPPRGRPIARLRRALEGALEGAAQQVAQRQLVLPGRILHFGSPL